jgi:hypothetical protein
MIVTNSRFITNPDTVPANNNHTVLVIDADQESINNIEHFCQISNKNYDIYLYEEKLSDLQWLNEVTNLADYVLINNTSHVTITGVDSQSKFGKNEEYAEPTAYFQNIDDRVDQL